MSKKSVKKCSVSSTELLERLSKPSFAFDPLRDIAEVVSGLSTDLTDALKTGVVRGDGSDEAYNHIDDPGAIVGRVNDVFDAIEASRAIRKYGKAPSSVVEDTSPSSPSPSAPNVSSPSSE